MLEGKLVSLSPLGLEHVDQRYVDWLNDPEVFRYLETKFGTTRGDIERYVTSFSPPNMICRICERRDGRHVGNITLSRYSQLHKHIALGIMIGEADARGKGYGREACSLLVDYAFRHLGMHRVYAGTVSENRAMARTFEQLGFKREGVLREHYFLDGDYLDVLQFGALRQDFVPAHG